MIIAIGKSRKDVHWKNDNKSWEDIVNLLKTPKRTAETVVEYNAMTNDARGEVKDVGGFVGGSVNGERRISSSVTERTLITLDVDNAYPDMWSIVTCLEEFAMVCYSTHSHTPENPRLRFVIPLSRPVTAEEYVPIARKVADWFGIETMDPSTYQPERLMYWPSVSKDGVFEFYEQEGYLLDPDEVLASYGEDAAWKDAALWPRAQCEGEHIRIPKVKKLQDPTTKGGLIGLFCRAYTIPDVIDTYLPDVYEEGIQGRYTYLPGTTANGAVLYDDDKFLHSHHGSDPAMNRTCNSFDLVRIHLFGHLDEGHQESEGVILPSMQAMLELASKDELVLELQHEELMQDFYTIIESKGETLSVDISDKGLARMFNLFVKGEVVFCPAIGFLAWDGKRFVEDDSAAMLRIIAFVEEVERRLFEHCLTNGTEDLIRGDSDEV